MHDHLQLPESVMKYCQAYKAEYKIAISAACDAQVVSGYMFKRATLIGNATLPQFRLIVQNAPVELRCKLLFMFHTLTRHIDILGLKLASVQGTKTISIVGPDPCSVLFFVQVDGKNIIKNTCVVHGVVRNIDPLMDVFSAMACVFIEQYTEGVIEGVDAKEILYRNEKAFNDISMFGDHASVHTYKKDYRLMQQALQGNPLYIKMILYFKILMSNLI
jgi:hypothetical protein